MIDQPDLIRLCAEVSRFGEAQNWRFKAIPTITWQFATISDFAGAEYALSNAIQKLCPYIRTTELGRYIKPGTLELDCHGVTFRLVCTEILMTQQGPRAAGEIEFERMPPDFLDELAKLRKSGSSY